MAVLVPILKFCKKSLSQSGPEITVIMGIGLCAHLLPERILAVGTLAVPLYSKKEMAATP